MAVPELGENVAQKLNFSLVIPIKSLKHENIHTQNFLICQENRMLISCILAFPLSSFVTVLNPIQNSEIVLEYQSVLHLSFAHSRKPLAYRHTRITHCFIFNE